MTLTDAIAADYLRVDNPDAGLLAEIDNMLQGAIALIERSTGYLYTARDKTYPVGADGYFRVYDFPINTDLTALPNSPTVQTKSTYTLIGNPTGAKELELNVGYTTPADFPDALGQAVLQLVKHFYYESETKAITGTIPTPVQAVINNYRRFIL